jgi:ABC-2 type transport system permease protein
VRRSPYLAAILSGARRAIADPADQLVRIIFYALILLAVGTLWRAAASAHGGSVAGYDGRALWWYIAGAEAAFTPLPARMIEEIGDEIGGGDVAIGLLRPVSYVGFRAASELGGGLVRLVGIVAVGLTFGLLTIGQPPSTNGLLLFVPCAILALGCSVAAQHAFGAAAFWLNDAKSTWFLYSKLVFLLGGVLLPLEVLPGPMRDAARALPFAAIAYAPGRSLSGHPSISLVGLQLGWLVALSAGAWYAFRRGQNKLQIAGG